MASILKIDISRNPICDNLVGFPKSGHICTCVHMYKEFYPCKAVMFMCTVGDQFKAKLSDFGLARDVYEDDYYKVTSAAELPVKWMAPESLLYKKFSTASDVW